jgi:hypothetical protein
MAGRLPTSYVCIQCRGVLHRVCQQPASNGNAHRRLYSSNAHANLEGAKLTDHKSDQDIEATSHASPGPEQGPLARRLEEATEEALLTGGRAGRQAVEDAGFSDELKERLLEKVKDAKFRSEHASALAEAGLPTSAGQGSRLAAASQPWTGQEPTEDAVLRMLNDAHKPLKPELRGRARMPDLKPVDMRFRLGESKSAGRRAATARDKAAVYTGMGLKHAEPGLSDAEREAMKKEFRERFKPAARAMPTTFTGLASLANERIEDAIARGQFKNIPRGKGVERDTRSDNPFIDTTEYLMNKMIKRQEIVPPWIEKQQEMAKTAHSFRTRLRNDWKRHAARMLASTGGSLDEQMKRARRLAQAEEVHNPRRRNVDQISVPTNTTEDAVMVQVRQQIAREVALELAPESTQDFTTPTEPAPPDDAPLPPPFRDPTWEQTERSYMELAISNLNALTRSYNLMAPELAKKPYFALQRELDSCYADVAPQLAEAIKNKALGPAKPSTEGLAGRPVGILDRFGREGHTAAKIYESRAPRYGFKEMWKDVFRRKSS